MQAVYRPEIRPVENGRRTFPVAYNQYVPDTYLDERNPVQPLIDLFLLLRRASFLASGDAQLHPVVKHHLSITEFTSYTATSMCCEDRYVQPDDSHLEYPFTATACVDKAYRIALEQAAQEPSSVSADLLWALGALQEELQSHDAECGDAFTQRVLADYRFQQREE